MFHWIEDKEFLKNMRSVCSDIVNQLVQEINKDDVMVVEGYLVGSGARNLETQNENDPVDLDYNLSIINVSKFDINDGKQLKEYIKKVFNTVLQRNGWDDCSDSTSALSTSRRVFKKGNQTPFSIDLGIISENNDGSWYRLIHNKTGIVSMDSWIWNQGPNSQNLVKRVEKIKNINKWNDVRDSYLEKKNDYLRRRDNNHPSFICYIEAVNEIYFQNYKK